MDLLAMFLEYKNVFLGAVLLTVGLSFASVVIGTVLGFLVSLMRLSRAKILNAVAAVYIEVIRGTPLLVQLFVIYLGSYSLFRLELPKLFMGLLAVSINSGAYISEIIRSGIQSVDNGQMEAGRSLGMSKSSTMRLIIVPQAVKNILPALCGEFVAVIKETSIVSYIGIQDLFYSYKIVGAATYKQFDAMLVVAVLYLALNIVLTYLIGKFERRLAQSD